MKFSLPVRINRSNGQPSVHLPKRSIGKMPERVDVRIPDEFIKKKVFDRGLKW